MQVSLGRISNGRTNYRNSKLGLLTKLKLYVEAGVSLSFSTRPCIDPLFVARHRHQPVAQHRLFHPRRIRRAA